MDRLRFCLNDRWVELRDVAPTTTLLRYLRDHEHLPGTKEGCAEGDCGACTVAVIEHDASGAPHYRAINSCLLLLPMIQDKHVYTVEALQRDGVHHPAQRAIAEKLGSQCGYCTPGVVMSVFEACYRSDFDEPWKLDDQLCGNLCRCTGYRPIREATHAVAGSCPRDAFTEALAKMTPPEMALRYRAGAQRFFTPATLEELFAIREENTDARLVAGGTDLSLEITKRFAEPPCLVSLEAIASLRALEERSDSFRLGASVHLSELEAFARDRLPPLERMLRYFGARQIKNRATIGGNLCTASPIGDLAPVFLALDAEAIVASRAGERRVALHEFFLGYRKTALAPNEVLVAIDVPRINGRTRAVAYKVSKRRELDISTVSASFAITTNANDVVSRARLAFGGMAATPARSRSAESELEGKAWSAESAERAALAVARDFQPLSDHRGSSRYRLLVAQNLVRGFFEETRASFLPRLPDVHTSTVLAS